MKKSKGKILIIVGVILLLAAAALIFHNNNQDKKSGEEAEKILLSLEEEISVQAATESTDSPIVPEETTENLFEKYEPATEPPEKTIEVDGKKYIGILVIPNLDIRLPVMSDWSYAKLKVSPCRYFGKASDGNLIIAAHNYSSHFGGISKLSGGDEITFISADGKEYVYEVVQTEKLNGKDVEQLKNDSSDAWSLTLFTCTLSGQSRVCVRAELKQDTTA